MRLVEVYVGTSGWMYDWNEWMNFDWYVRFSGLNAVELNASFYRFPFPSQVQSWARKGSGLRWAVKVHRSITHYSRLRGRALEVWEKFRRLFEPLDKLVDFYLFQLPPSYAKTRENIETLKRFFKAVGLGRRAAVEFRHESWFNSETLEVIEEVEATIVSIDSPIATWIVESGGTVYLRMHGRTAWYAHEYTLTELLDVARRILELNPARVYVFFNNNHWMLGNARMMLALLRRLSSSPQSLGLSGE